MRTWISGAVPVHVHFACVALFFKLSHFPDGPCPESAPIWAQALIVSTQLPNAFYLQLAFCRLRWVQPLYIDLCLYL